MNTTKWMVISMGMMLGACGGTDTQSSNDSGSSLSAKEASAVSSGKADSIAASAASDAPSRPSNGDEASADVASSSVDDSAADSSGTDADIAADLSCSADECGPGLRAPIIPCDDGTFGGPICERDEAGVCGWDIRVCPEVACAPDECGPQTTRPPIFECSDGSQGGLVCARDKGGVCEWTNRQCPADCKPELCGDQPDWLLGCNGEDLEPICTEDASFSDAADVSPNCSWKLPPCDDDTAEDAGR